MDKLIYGPAAAITEQSLIRQGLVNEMANVSTIGFKRSLDVAMRAVKIDGQGFDTRYQPQNQMLNQVMLEPGPVMVTGRALDVAMDGATVLGVRAANGELAFTRRGDLRTNAQGVLETGAGHAVQGTAGPITVPPGFQVRITSDGQVLASDPTQAGAVPDELVGQLLLRDASATPLARRADGLFRVANETRPGSDFDDGDLLPAVIPQSLEGSNVSAVGVMTKLLDHSRTFEAQIRVVKEMKDLDASGVSMMKLGS
jgi:flagellar basal-body rod protein FlgF